MHNDIKKQVYSLVKFNFKRTKHRSVKSTKHNKRNRFNVTL